MNAIPSRYSPKETEDKWYKFWEGHNLFSAKPSLTKKPFCIVIPPPNVTGILHMGHALNNTIQDILIRYHRMKGEESLWMPGTDHAGIATQNVVEKALAKDGLKRQDLGREKFIERVWQWKEQYGSTIILQLKKLGASCDWSRTRFTMDEEYSRAVKDVFIMLWNKGLVYQDDKVINWCPRCQTALSDEEAPHHEIKGNLYYIRYPFKETTVHSQQSTEKTKSMDYWTLWTMDYIVVATTRPETMLGDSAVAVNPKDKRYKQLIGRTLILPLINREIKIIADSMVDMKFGTGAVKVTPAHDPNDYVLGKKHNLEFINIMHLDARLNEKAGDYRDMDRFEAREVIIEDLKAKNLLEKVAPHSLSAGHCYRCHTLIEPYLSRQWFVKMKPLAKPAIEAVKKGKIKFYPKRWTKVYLNWMENIQDWCISRQIWWGHRLPIYYCKSCPKKANESTVHSQQSTEKTKSMDYWTLWTMDYKGIIVSRDKPDKCPACGSIDIYQDEDVLDTWFSSWLWPFAVFGWPFASQKSIVNSQHSTEKTKTMDYWTLWTMDKTDLDYFYPTAVLVTAPEIIFFWVARMIMAGFEFMGKEPFRDVYIHGTVRDIEGKKMSKSLGNIIDPLEIIDEYGADALRFGLISITAQGQDIFLSKERFEQGRNFANKIWNASRLILMNLEPVNLRTDLCEFFKKEDLDFVDRWILSRFYSTLKEVNRNLGIYRFNEAANILYRFFWHEFCDWYLEIIKPDINPVRNTKALEEENEISNGVKNRLHQVVMYKVLEKFLRILHPFMPFITEEIWQRLPHEGISIMIQSFPHIQEQVIDKMLEKKILAIFELITKIRELKNLIEVESEKDLVIFVNAHTELMKSFIENNKPVIERLVGLHSLNIMGKSDKTKFPISTVTKDFIIYLRFKGSFDPAVIKNRIKNKIDKLNNILKTKADRLSNRNFVEKAPKEVVESEKESKRNLSNELKELEKIFNGL